MTNENNITDAQPTHGEDCADLFAILKCIEIAQRAYCSDEDCKCERCLTAGLIEKDLRDYLLIVDGRKALKEK